MHARGIIYNLTVSVYARLLDGYIYTAMIYIASIPSDMSSGL